MWAYLKNLWAAILGRRPKPQDSPAPKPPH